MLLYVLRFNDVCHLCGRTEMYMKKSLSFWQFAGFLFTAVAGVLLHFLYDWSNQSVFIAPFSAINESIWEHMKLLYFPMFAFALVERQFIGDEYANYWCAKLAGILLGLTLIPVLYYSYTGIFGVQVDWINIAIFFVATATTYLFETWLLKKEGWKCPSPLLALLVLCLIGYAFVIWTYTPPAIPLFQDPMSGKYGVFDL